MTLINPAYHYQDLKFNEQDTRDDYETVLATLEWEVMGHKAFLNNLEHTPQHPVIGELMQAGQERLSVRCALANLKKDGR